MLVLPRRKNESIVINDDMTVVIVEIRGGKVQLGIDVPRFDCQVHRREVYDAIRREGEKPISTTIMIPESGMKALDAIRSKVPSLPKENGPIIAAILEAVAKKRIKAKDLEGLKESI